MQAQCVFQEGSVVGQPAGQPLRAKAFGLRRQQQLEAHASSAGKPFGGRDFFIRPQFGNHRDCERRHSKACAQFFDDRRARLRVQHALARFGGVGQRGAGSAGNAQQAKWHPPAVVGHMHRGVQDGLQLRSTGAGCGQLPGGGGNAA